MFKKTILTCTLVSAGTLMHAQTDAGTGLVYSGYCCQTKISARDRLMTMIDTANNRAQRLDLSTSKSRLLVTPYTFHRREAKDFAKILTGENSFAASSRYAFLKIDESESRVTFAPLAFHSPNISERGFRYFGNIGMSAAVNSDGVLKIFSNSKPNGKIDAFLNFSILLKHYRTINGGTRQTTRQFQPSPSAEMVAFRRNYLNCLERFSCDSSKALCNVCCNDDADQAYQDALDEFADCEEIKAAGYWRNDVKKWLTFSFTGKYNSVYGVDQSTKKLDDLSYYAAGFKGTFNYLATNTHGRSLYFKAFASLESRSIFSEMDALTWNKTQPLTSNTSLTEETESVYLYDPQTYKREYRPAFGIQGIGISHYDHVPLIREVFVGLDVQYDFLSLPSANAGHGSIDKHNISAGLIIPFKDDEGNSKINVELFHTWSIYSTSDFDNSSYWGLKFSVPLP